MHLLSSAVTDYNYPRRLYVCLFVCALKEKRLELSDPKSVDI